MGLFDSMRRASARRKATGALGAFYAAPLRDDRYLAVDIETTGLDPSTDRLLSIGWVPVDGDEIVLGGAGHVVIRGAGGEESVGQSATLHGLTDDQIAAGVDREEAVELLLRALAGRTLLAHYARMEVGFLDKACREIYGAPFNVDTADTMDREYARYAAMDRDPGREDLRLWNTRDRYGLPPYKAHHALTDALSCAELWLAQNAAGLKK